MSRLRIAAMLLGSAVLLPLTWAIGGETIDEARAHAKAARWEEAARVLNEHLKRSAGDPEVMELYGRSLIELGRKDEAAHFLDQAAELYQERGDKRGAGTAKRSLSRADPLATRRESLLRNITTQLYRAAEQMAESGHTERALDLLRRIDGIAKGKDADDLRELLAKVQAAFEEVDLDSAGGEAPLGGAHPLVELESAHYRLACNLEEDVVQLVADTMDDIHAYYVQLYFDGDERKATGAKATIRVHPDKESMLGNWQGGSAPEGWWSPGENQVTCYDTRSSTGSLDWMLTTLFHEASHQFMTFLSRKGGWAPAWLNEGTASFFEGAVAMADHRVLWPDAALPRLQSLSSMLQNRSGPTLTDVVGYSGGGSYPGNYYPYGWGLVYFLQQYEDPETLEYVYRPSYAAYREAITAKGGDSMERFAETFLGPSSPLGHISLSDFERDWEAWILETVRPLHISAPTERRELRRARIDRYLAAAELAAGARRAPVSEADLLRRALGNVEYVRTRIDGEEHPQLEIFLLQADLLERLDRDKGAAPIVEAILDLADEDVFELDEEQYAELEKRLKKLDGGNAALRSARSKIRGLTKSTTRLVDQYREGDDPMLLRAYTLAAAAGAALDDTEGLIPMADELRELAREAGLLLGSVRALDAKRGAWTTIYTTEAKDFRVGNDSIEIESVRPVGYLCTDIRVGSEYELRARLARRGEVYRSSAHALIIAGGPGTDWYAFGFSGDGHAGLWRVTQAQGGGASSRLFKSLYLEQPLEEDEQPQVAIHVSNRRQLEIHIEGHETLEAELPPDFPGGRHVGVYVKDGRLELRDPVVELFP